MRGALVLAFAMGLCFFQAKASNVSYLDSGIFVGNGGEGYWIGGKLWLRDLVEQGVHQNPFIGQHVDEEVLEIARDFDIPGFEFSREKFLKKLSDLQRLSPHLGIYILEALRSYNWSLVDVELSRIPDDSPILDIPEEKRVTIANRYGGSIRVQRALWSKLPEDHRIALLIHEGAYALTRVYCDVGGSGRRCRQFSKTARDLVGSAFSAHLPGAASLKAVLKELQLPDGLEACSHPVSGLTLRWWRHTGRRMELLLEKKLSDSVFDIKWRETFIRDFCKSKDREASQMEISMSRLPYRKFFVPYPSSTPLNPQYAVSLQRRVGEISKFFSALDFNGCKKVISDLSRAWLDLEIMNEGYNSCHSSEPL